MKLLTLLREPWPIFGVYSQKVLKLLPGRPWSCLLWLKKAKATDVCKRVEAGGPGTGETLGPHCTYEDSPTGLQAKAQCFVGLNMFEYQDLAPSVNWKSQGSDMGSNRAGFHMVFYHCCFSILAIGSMTSCRHELQIRGVDTQASPDKSSTQMEPHAPAVSLRNLWPLRAFEKSEPL